MSLSSYPRQYLYCRAWGHDLEDRGSFVEHDKFGRRRIAQRLTCACGWAVARFFTMRLVRFGQPAYTHPPGWSPVPSVAEARAEWFAGTRLAATRYPFSARNPIG